LFLFASSRKVTDFTELTMHSQTPTEEAFVLASLKEFVKLWGSGSQASFQLECKDRQACLKFSTQLGSPADLHFVPPFLSHGFHERPQNTSRPRRKGPAQRERDRARAAAHRGNQQLLIEADKPAAAATELSDSVQHSQQNQVTASLAGSQSPSTAPAGGPLHLPLHIKQLLQLPLQETIFLV
jgi:hypothetical protein